MPKTNELVESTCPNCGRSRTVQFRPDRPINRQCRSCSIAAVDHHWVKTHGETKTKLYKVWLEMRYRCYRKKHKWFRIYGGRGISVSPQWRSDFVAFRDWAYANGYQLGLQIDRRDNDGPYSPINCQWSTPAANSRNKRTTLLTPLQVSQIKFLRNMGVPYSRITQLFDISDSTVWSIAKGHNWKDIPPLHDDSVTVVQ